MILELDKIIKGCKKRKRKSQAALYEHTVDDLMNICIRYLGNSQFSKDALQNVYLKAFQKIDTYDTTKGSIGAWLAKITVNECLIIIRKKKRILFLDNIKGESPLTTDEDVVSSLSANEIYEEIKNMPDGYRIIFNLYVVEGYNHTEIGKALGITASSSRSQLTRAKNYLRKAITQKSKLSVYEKAK